VSTTARGSLRVRFSVVGADRVWLVFYGTRAGDDRFRHDKVVKRPVHATRSRPTIPRRALPRRGRYRVQAIVADARHNTAYGRLQAIRLR
jgi:hypothetical protein